MKHCDARIIVRIIVCGIPNPWYNGLWFDLKGFALIRFKFWFCANDLTCCVGGTKKKLTWFNLRWQFWRRQDLFCVKGANVFLKPFLWMKVQHLVIDLYILKLGQNSLLQAIMFKLSTQQINRFEVLPSKYG
jgi:hypothetical protein